MKRKEARKDKVKQSKPLPRFIGLLIKNLKTMFRDKAQLAWIFGYPLFFIVIFAVAFGGGGSRASYEVVIINDDIIGIDNPEQSYFGNASLLLIDIMESEDLKDYVKVVDGDDFAELKNPKDNDDLYDRAYELLKYEQIDGIIRVNKNYSEAMYNMSGAGNPKVKIKTTNDEVTEGVLGSIVGQITSQMQLNIANVNPAEIDLSQAEDVIELTILDYLAPGFIIAGVTVCISQLATHFSEEKQNKTLERLTTTPVTKRDIISSALLSELAVCFVQVIIMLLLTSFVFGVYIHPEANILLLILIPLLFCFTCLGIALILASLYKSQSSNALTWLIILPLQFLGGIFTMGLDIPISDFVPTSYAVHAMRLVMTSGISSWEAIGMDIIVLLGTGIGFTLLGIILFQQKTK